MDGQLFKIKQEGKLLDFDALMLRVLLRVVFYFLIMTLVGYITINSFSTSGWFLFINLVILVMVIFEILEDKAKKGRLYKDRYLEIYPSYCIYTNNEGEEVVLNTEIAGYYYTKAFNLFDIKGKYRYIHLYSRMHGELVEILTLKVKLDTLREKEPIQSYIYLKGWEEK